MSTGKRLAAASILPLHPGAGEHDTIHDHGEYLQPRPAYFQNLTFILILCLSALEKKKYFFHADSHEDIFKADFLNIGALITGEKSMFPCKFKQNMKILCVS